MTTRPVLLPPALPLAALRRAAMALLPWLLAIMVGLIAGTAGTQPRLAGAGFGVVLLVLVGLRLLRRPMLGLELMAVILPFFPMFRNAGTYLGIGLPYGILGLWPEVVLSVMLVSVAVRAIKAGGKLQVRRDVFPFLVMTVGCAYGVSLTISMREYVSAMYGFHGTFLGYFLFWVTYWLRPTPAETRRFIGLWLVSYTVFALLSLADYIFRPAFIIELAMLARPDFWGTWEPHMFFRWYPRMQSLLFAEQMWGTACALVSLYCLSWYSERKRPRFILFVFVLSTLCVALSMSRGSLVCWCVGIVALLFSRGRHRVAVLVALTMVAGAVMASVVYLGGSDKIDTLTQRAMALFESKDNSAYNRVDQWKFAFELFPLFPSGRGLGRGGPSAALHGINDGFPAIVDGGYFTVLTEQGVPGTLLYVFGGLGVVGAFARKGRELERAGDREGLVLCRATGAFFCGALVQTFAGLTLEFYYVSSVFWILAGLVMARRLPPGELEPATKPAGLLPPVS